MVVLDEANIALHYQLVTIDELMPLVSQGHRTAR
jgi:ATP:corrinoid adenosyltransferase